MKAELIDHMGDDLSVVNAARVSFDKESEWEWVEEGAWAWQQQILSDADTKLISYLAKHDHWTPFAHTSISLRMQAPVPIRTQCFKHKQGLVENEESRRYISGKPTVYTPKTFRSAPTNGAKQGSGDAHPKSGDWRYAYRNWTERSVALYEEMIADGVAPEQARFILPQGCEVQWIWTGNLYAFANFYLKRTDPHAQKEIQDLARMVGDIIEPLFPVSWKALTNV
jgi:thymidylate synthase (FAD)